MGFVKNIGRGILGAAGGFLGGGPIGAAVGGIGGLFGGKRFTQSPEITQRPYDPVLADPQALSLRSTLTQAGQNVLTGDSQPTTGDILARDYYDRLLRGTGQQVAQGNFAGLLQGLDPLYQLQAAQRIRDQSQALQASGIDPGMARARGVDLTASEDRAQREASLADLYFRTFQGALGQQERAATGAPALESEISSRRLRGIGAVSNLLNPYYASYMPRTFGPSPAQQAFSAAGTIGGLFGGGGGFGGGTWPFTPPFNSGGGGVPGYGGPSPFNFRSLFGNRQYGFFGPRRIRSTPVASALEQSNAPFSAAGGFGTGM